MTSISKPVYCKLRTFIGEKDLVITLYTLKCQFKCSFCALQKNSSNKPVSSKNQIAQLNFVFEKYSNKLGEIERISIGNEGSIFDETRVPFEVIEYLAKKCNAIDNIRTVSFETRPEYITNTILGKIKLLFVHKNIDCTVGYETQSEIIRNKINKLLSEKAMTKAIENLSRNKCSLTSYVLIKPDIQMSNEGAILEAKKTIDHLVELTSKHSVPLTIYLNPLYIPIDSKIHPNAKTGGPPLACSVIKIIKYCLEKYPKLPMYIGIYSENLAKPSNEFYCPKGLKKQVSADIKKLNSISNQFLFKQFCCDSCEHLTGILI